MPALFDGFLAGCQHSTMTQTNKMTSCLLALVMLMLVVQASACAGEAETAPESASATEETASVSSPAKGPQPGGEPDPAAASSEEGKPGLADKMRVVIEEAGDPIAVNKALRAFDSEELSDYEMDEAGILALGREYLEAGDDTRAEIVFSFLQTAAYQVTGTVSADVWTAHGDVSRSRGNNSRAKEMYELALSTDPDLASAKEGLASLGGVAAPESSAAPRREEPAAALNRLSEGRRSDLARFRFKYADTEDPGRQIWLSETCYNSGVLRGVPQWGDQTPWVFESLAENLFEQSNAAEGEEPVRLEFELHHGHGGILGLLVSGGAEGRFEEAGYLPEGWEPEIGTCD